MARTTATNFSGGLQFPYATAATDIFKKEDLQTLAQAVDQHDHTAGKGVAVNTTPAAGSITNSMLGADVARANLLTNGGFEIWSRGTGAFATNAAYSSDRWSLGIVGTDTLSVSKDTGNANIGSVACAACTFGLGTGGGGTIVTQLLKASDGTALRGKTVSLSLTVKTATANAVQIGLYRDGTGGGYVYSTFHTGGSTWQTLTVSNVAIPLDVTYLQISVFFAASCTAYLDNAMLVVGSQAANYVPMHPADDLARCQRYYELLAQPNDGTLQPYGYLPAGVQALNASLPYKVFKPVTPTVTVVGTWGVPTNMGQPTTASIGQSGVRLTMNTTGAWAAGLAYAINNAAGNNLSVEANP